MTGKYPLDEALQIKEVIDDVVGQINRQSDRPTVNGMLISLSLAKEIRYISAAVGSFILDRHTDQLQKHAELLAMLLAERDDRIGEETERGERDAQRRERERERER